MKVHYDPQADAVYLMLDSSRIVESEEVQPDVVLDYDDKRQVIGVEILHVSRRIPESELKQLSVEVA